MIRCEGSRHNVGRLGLKMAVMRMIVVSNGSVNANKIAALELHSTGIMLVAYV